MAKSAAQREYDQADRAFRKAWKLLDRIERRLEEARAVERKRLRQLGDGSGAGRGPSGCPARGCAGRDRRDRAAADRALGPHRAHARMTTGQTVQDVAISVAAEIKDEAAEPPTLSTTRRNRHHRPRRRPADGARPGSRGRRRRRRGARGRRERPNPSPSTGDGDVIELTAPTATRRNRHHRPRRRPADETAAEVAATDSTTAEPEPAPDSEPVPVPDSESVAAHGQRAPGGERARSRCRRGRDRRRSGPGAHRSGARDVGACRPLVVRAGSGRRAGDGWTAGQRAR